jgi:hypothetical protein
VDLDPADLSGERPEVVNLAGERPEVGWVLPDLVVGKEVCWGNFRLYHNSMHAIIFITVCKPDPINCFLIFPKFNHEPGFSL